MSNVRKSLMKYGIIFHGKKLSYINLYSLSEFCSRNLSHCANGGVEQYCITVPVCIPRILKCGRLAAHDVIGLIMNIPLTVPRRLCQYSSRREGDGLFNPAFFGVSIRDLETASVIMWTIARPRLNNSCYAVSMWQSRWAYRQRSPLYQSSILFAHRKTNYLFLPVSFKSRNTPNASVRLRTFSFR